MPDADFFSALGFFTRRGFLDTETCARLRAEVREGPTKQATVLEDERVYDVDRTSRSTDWAEVSDDAVALVKDRLTSVMPAVADHYGLRLVDLQTPQVLVYREGDFFRLHRDSGESAAVPDLVGARQIAAVAFLNDEGDPASSESYRGGALTFYGLFDEPQSETIGFPLEPEEGLLVTFPANVLHEVRRVDAGERYTVVTWFVGDGS
jgi:predicted 2-oxoglutarate/Fe(II)-dependent dioxygenase YbiX